MSSNKEIELKLRCTNKSVWDSILKAKVLRDNIIPRSEGIKLMEAHYFDTPDHVLQKAGIAFRVRREGEQWVATIKGGGSAKGGLHERQEWNVPVNNALPDITVFSQLEIGSRLLKLAANKELQPILITKFERQTLDVNIAAGTIIEVAADCGRIIAREMTEPILEIELELKAGSQEALLVLGNALLQDYPLELENKSKFYRGLKLAELV